MAVREEVVTATLCNIKAHLSVLGCIDIIQDMTASTLGDIGCDNVTLKNIHNAAWVFVKNKIKFYKPLKWNDTFRVTSFISSYTKITVCIDIIFKNKNDEIAVYSRLEACPIDLDTHKIRRVNSIGFPSFLLCEKANWDYPYTKFEFKNPKKIFSLNVLSQSIDFSKHTNNTEYIRFILNTYTVKELEQMDIKDLEIHYLHESKEQDFLTIYKDEGQEDLFCIKKEDIPIAEVRIGKQ